MLATAFSPDARNLLLPPALVDSTTRAVVQFVTLRIVGRRSAASLAHGVLKSMLMTQRLKVASALFMLGAAVTGAGLFAQNQKTGDQPRAQDTNEAARPATRRSTRSSLTS